MLDAVRRCWASLWTDRAIAYRDTQGIDHRTVRLAVVVQVMVDAEVAGVLFTANPVTGRRREAVIDASPGLGEAVVSGAVTPDHFVIDTGTGRVLQQPHRRQAPCDPVAAPPVAAPSTIPAAATGTACLTATQLRSLAGSAAGSSSTSAPRRTSSGPSTPDGTLWLTQSRPITTLFPLPEAAPDRPGLRAYFCFSVAQGLYRPLTPAGLSAFRLLGAGAAALYGRPVVGDVRTDHRVFAEAGQRIFIDMTGPLRSRVGRAFLPRVFDLMETRSATILRDLFDRSEFSLTQRRCADVAASPARRGPLSHSGVHRPGVDQSGRSATAGRSHHHRSAGPAAHVLRHSAADVRSATELLDRVETLLTHETVPMAPRIVPGAIAGLAMFGLAQRLLGAQADPGELQTVLRGLPHNADHRDGPAALADREADPPTTTSRPQVLRTTPATELAERYRAGDAASRPSPTGWRGSSADTDTAPLRRSTSASPRWSDDPTHILGVLANYLRLDRPGLAPDVVFARGAAKREQMIVRLAADGAWRGRGAAVVRSRWAAPGPGRLREVHKNYIVLMLAAARRRLGASEPCWRPAAFSRLLTTSSFSR